MVIIMKSVLAKFNATNKMNSISNCYSILTHNIIGHIRVSLADGSVNVHSLIS